MIRLQKSRFMNLRNLHAGPRGENSRQLAVAFGSQMHDHDKGGASTVGQRFEERLQRLDAAGGGADSDDRRVRLFRLGALLLVRVAFSIFVHTASSRSVSLVCPRNERETTG